MHAWKKKAMGRKNKRAVVYRTRNGEARRPYTPLNLSIKHTRCSTGKNRYANEHDAALALAVIQGFKDLTELGKKRREERIYRCPECAGVHLTSKPRSGRDTPL